MERGRAAIAVAALALGLPALLPGSSLASHVRPRGATPLSVSLVPAYYQCTSPNRTHGAPLAFGSCAPPQTTALTTTIGTPDANGAPAKSIGSFRVDALTGDARITLSVSDVRCTASTNADVCQTAN